MPTVVVTVTQSTTSTATAAASGSSSSLSPETTAGIIIGALLGGVLLIVLVLYLFKRYRGHKFTRVANPTHDDADLQYAPGISSRRSKRLSRHSHKPSMSSEPLIVPPFLPPLPFSSRDRPARSDAISPISAVTGDSPRSSFDVGEISQVIASGTVSRGIMLDTRPSSVSSQLTMGNSPPRTRQMSGDCPPSTPTKTQQPFLHRALKSRAEASEDVSPPRLPSLDISRSPSTTLGSAEVRAEEEQLLAEAERTAVRDAEIARRKEDEDDVEAEGWEEVDADSSYSQPSASGDHYLFFSDPTSRQNSISSLPGRKSSRKPRTPAAAAVGLSPVAEMPDTPGVSRSVSRKASLSQVSHRTVSPLIALEHSGAGVTFPLLASVNFGKDGTSSGTRSASISSMSALGSSSNGRASRYPSLATSSMGLSSHSRQQSDADTDWFHPPPGLAGLASRIEGPLQNPHSPVEERPTTLHPDVLTPAKRARLRKGTTSSIPEVERRVVTQGGIAHIDVAL